MSLFLFSPKYQTGLALQNFSSLSLLSFRVPITAVIVLQLYVLMAKRGTSKLLARDFFEGTKLSDFLYSLYGSAVC